MKMKKIISAIVLMVSLITGICLLSGLEKGVTYFECIISKEQAEDVISEREEVAYLIDDLFFGEEKLFYDDSAKTFYYSLIEEDSNAYNPSIRAEGKAEYLQLAFLENKISEEGIKNNETIAFLAYTDTTYCQYYLKCTTLPLMNIECQEEIPDELISMEMTLFDNREGSVRRLVHSEGKIRLRGATAKAYPKKGFRFSLTTESLGGNVRSNHTALLGMRQDDDWLLYGAYNDQEKVRNVFTSNLWKYTCATDNEQKIDFGMEYKYLELFVNGEYWGLYALGYPIDEKQVCIGMNSSEAALYKHGLLEKQGGENLQFTKEGKIFDNLAESTDENLRRQSLLQNYYYNLYTNADNNERLRAGIDPDNAVDFYLFVNLIQGADNIDMVKNFYILLQNEKEGAKALYAPWDLDLTWGNQYIGLLSNNYTAPYANPADFNCIIESGYISQLIINGDASIWDMIFEKYRTLRESKWSENNINMLLDEYEADIFTSGAYLRDMERWPDGIYGNAADQLNAFRTHVMNRLQETDLYYSRLKAIYEETSNIFIRRSIQYKNFFESCFLIEINNHDLMKDSDYSGFFEYMGVDVSKVTEKVRFILVNPIEKKVEYLPSLYEENEPRISCIGRLSFSEVREGVYDVKVNGVECYMTTVFDKPEIAMSIIKDTKIYRYNFTKGYVMQKWKSSFEELTIFIEALSKTNYRAVIEINNPELWQDEAYSTLFESLGIKKEDIHTDTDFIVWNGLEKTAFALDDFHVSGSSCDTQYGSFSVFENELGEYGVYLDGNECFVSSQDKNQNVDIRIALLNPESYERVDMISFSDDVQ